MRNGRISGLGNRNDGDDVIYDVEEGQRGVSDICSFHGYRTTPTFANDVGVTTKEGLHDALVFVEVLQMFECLLERHEVAWKHSAVEAERIGTSINRPDDKANASLLSSSLRAAE